ncbi:hypothetical protein AVEN_17319-1 [Araneus ventricosus]|uniref:Uncharacterized protein n=1 Tax=Araneus ventricosus TaxID=182803 RepID=A0A4Y2TF02_ARAVE|nr:hypothetical protein AVEN_17319-1 [Araneus ventricosus]
MAIDKERLLPSGVQGLVPTETALSSFTMNRSPIVLDRFISGHTPTLSYVQRQDKRFFLRASSAIHTNLLQTISHVWSWRRGTSLKVLLWFVIFCGRADSWTWSS